MYCPIKLLVTNLLSLILVRWAGAQTDSTQLKTAALQKAYQQTLNAYETFEAVHGHFLKTPNSTLHYLSWGKPTGQPLVWVHGTGSNGYEISRVADSLAKKGYYVLAIDYYGHGKTPIPTHEVSVYHVADDIAYLLNNLHIQKTIIGGWSRGGTIATAFYAAYPSRVTAIILEDGGSVCFATPYYKLGQTKAVNEITQLYQKTPIEEMLKSFPTKFELFCHYQASGLFNSDNGPLALSIVHDFNQSPTGQWSSDPGLIMWLGEDSPQAFIRNMFAPTQGPLFEQSFRFLEPKLVYRNLQVPLLIYDPTNSTDVLLDFEEANRRLQQDHPKWITHLVYPDTQHAVKFQRFDRFYADLSKFLARIEKPKK